jgi:hypothetical protein
MADLEIIAEGNVDNSSTSLSLTGIDQSYEHLSIDLNFQEAQTNYYTEEFRVTINGDGLSSFVYGGTHMSLKNGSAWLVQSFHQSGYVLAIMGFAAGSLQSAHQRSACRLFFPGYSNTNFEKSWLGRTNSQSYSQNDADSLSFSVGSRTGTSAITAIEIRGSGSANIACNYTMYGWKSA